MTGWEALEEELGHWARGNRQAAFWWRDDDAVVPGPGLVRLLDLAAAQESPLALAVIPAGTGVALSRELAERGQDCAVLQHGLAHENLAPAGAKKCELVDLPGQAEALATARLRLAELFGGRFLPVLVPPWNRIHERLVPRLGACGFSGLSTFMPRAQPEAAPGLRRVNCHVDLMRWRPERRFAGEAETLEQICRQLSGRRSAVLDPAEPCGILTHHLVHDSACWAFLARLLETLKRHAGACMLSVPAVFGRQVFGPAEGAGP